MSLEDKVKDLENRLEKLEKIEKRRKIKNIIVLSFYGLIVIGIIVLLTIFYYKIKPYKEQLDNLKNFGNNLKTDTIIGGDSYNDFNDFFNGLFNY